MRAETSCLASLTARRPRRGSAIDELSATQDNLFPHVFLNEADEVGERLSLAVGLKGSNEWVLFFFGLLKVDRAMGFLFYGQWLLLV